MKFALIRCGYRSITFWRLISQRKGLGGWMGLKGKTRRVYLSIHCLEYENDTHTHTHTHTHTQTHTHARARAIWIIGFSVCRPRILTCLK